MLTPTPLSIWKTEAPSKMTTLTPSAKLFTGGPNDSKPVSSFTAKTMRHIRHPPYTKNVTLSYPHKIDWHRLTNVCYGSLKGSKTLIIYSLLTVWRQSIDRQWYKVCELKHGRIYMSTYLVVCLSVSLSVCLWVCLYVYQKGILPLASDLYKLRHCLGLKHNFVREDP